MFRCCLDLVKFVLFIVNFAAFVAIGLLLSGAIYTLLEPEQVLGFDVEVPVDFPDFSKIDIQKSLYFILIVSAIILFGFLVIFTFLGCCGAACKSRCMLGSFIIFLTVFLLANVAGIVYMYIKYPGGEVPALKGELKKTIAYYDPEDDNSISKRFWDAIQTEIQCCGADTIYDWSQMNDHLKGERKVPASCCGGRTPQDQQCVFTPNPTNGGFMHSCVDKIEFPYRIAFWAVPGFMALMLIFALIVCSKSGREAGSDYERAPSQPARRPRHSRSSRAEQGYTEEDPANWEFSQSYPTAPPYNPAHQDGYSGGHRGRVDQYPTGQIPYVQQPLMDQPPRYQDVAYQPYRDGGRVQYQ